MSVSMRAYGKTGILIRSCSIQRLELVGSYIIHSDTSSLILLCKGTIGRLNIKNISFMFLGVFLSKMLHHKFSKYIFNQPGTLSNHSCEGLFLGGVS